MRAFRPLQHISMWGIWLDLMFNIPPKDAPTEALEKSKDLAERHPIRELYCAEVDPAPGLRANARPCPVELRANIPYCDKGACPPAQPGTKFTP